MGTLLPYFILSFIHLALILFVLYSNTKEKRKKREESIQEAITRLIDINKRLKMDRLFADKEIADRFCIQEWDGSKFDCECKDLGVKTSEMVCY